MHEGLKSHILELLKKDLRLDKRKSLEYRTPIKVEYGISKSAEGSAQVTIGETIVMTGVKLDLGTPYPDTPDEGCLSVGAELLPLSNPEFELGPPGIQAIEIGRVVDRGIRESKALDMKKLCIEPGSKAWVISIDICPINDAGNLLDAAALSALAALKDTRLPKLEKIEEAYIVNYKEKTKEKLPFSKDPVSVTVCKIGDKFIVDPTIEEENIIDARLTVATTEKDEICAMQKGGEEPLTVDEIDKMVDIAVGKIKELRKAL
jgi:exosome complex component RRP42